MTRYSRLVVVAIFLAVAGRTATVEAAPITFADRASFELAVSTFTTFTFDTVDPCPVFNPANFTCIQTYGPVKFGFDAAGAPGGSNQLALGVNGLAFTTALSSPVRALALDLVGGSPGSSLVLELGWAAGPAISTLLSAGGPAFFGALDDVNPFTTLSMAVSPQGPQSVVTIDNLTVAKVPEPATFLLLGTAALGLLATSRRRKK
jgi:hypothetical protein